MKKLLRSPALLLVLVVVMIAAAGIVYAHWSTTARVKGQVNTGNVAVGFADYFTDDDGWVYSDDFDPRDIGGFDAPEFDWNEWSSADPMEPGPLAPRYPKDVANCYVQLGGDESGELLEIWVDNAYPSYYCTIVGQLVNQGSIPIKAEPGEIIRVERFEYGECFTSWKLYDDDSELLDLFPPGAQYNGDEFGDYVDQVPYGPFDYDNGDYRILNSNDQPNPNVYMDYYLDRDNNGEWTGEGEFELYPDGYCEELNPTELRFAPIGGGVWQAGLEAPELTIGFDPGQCGYQLDPGFDGQEPNRLDMRIWLHVEQDALQNAGYRFYTEQPFRNWNEFNERELCAPD